MKKILFDLNFLLLWIIFVELLSIANNTVAFEYFNGYQIKELASLTEQLFNLEAQPWTAIGLSTSNKTTKCSNNFLLGGFGILKSGGYFERYYASLPVHNIIYFKAEIFVLDEWHSSDKFRIQFDGVNIAAGGVIFDTSFFHSNVCGLAYNDLEKMTLISKSLHNSSNLTVKIISKVRDSSITSFGIRNVNLIFANISDAISYDGCFYVSDINAIQGGGVTGCSCPIGTYPDPLDPTQCLNCDQSCSDCFGPSAGECYDCKPGYSFVETECIKCHSSCDTCSGPNEDQCVTCSNSLWLHWNNTCLSTCDSSATAQEEIDDFKVCHTPCSSSEFMLWNQTCVNSCVPPLVQKIIRNDNLCQKPCRDGEFIYPNGSCLPICSSPLVSKTAMDIPICDYPCNFLQNQLLFWDNSCQDSCPSPNIQRIESEFRYCDKYVMTDNQEENLIEQVVEVISITGNIAGAGIITANVANIGTKTQMIVSSAPSTAFSIVALSKMLQYIRYMNINYPKRLEYLLLNQNSTSISINFGPEIPSKIRDLFKKYPLPDKFGFYDLHPSFIVNFGDALSTLIIIIVIILYISSSLLESLTAKHNKEILHLIFVKIKKITKWDLFLVVLCTNFDGVAFFSSLQIRTIPYFSSWSDIISIYVCFTMNFVLVLIVLKTFRATLKYRKRKFMSTSPSALNEPRKTFKNKLGTLHILIRSFKDKSFLQQSFLLFFFIRIYVFDLIIGYLFEYPLLQAIMIVIISTLMLIYLSTQRPFRDKSDIAEFIINETMLFVVSVNVLILAILDSEDAEALETRAACGDAIIICNFVFNILSLIFVGFEIFRGLIKAYKLLKTAKDKKSWMKLILLLFEKDGMALEEEQEKSKEADSRIDNKKVKIELQQGPKHNLSVKTDLFHSFKEDSSKSAFLCVTPAISQKESIILNDVEKNCFTRRVSEQFHRNSIFTTSNQSLLSKKFNQPRNSELRTQSIFNISKNQFDEDKSRNNSISQFSPIKNFGDIAKDYQESCNTKSKSETIRCQVFLNPGDCKSSIEEIPNLSLNNTKVNFHESPQLVQSKEDRQEAEELSIININ